MVTLSIFLRGTRDDRPLAPTLVCLVSHHSASGGASFTYGVHRYTSKPRLTIHCEFPNSLFSVCIYIHFRNYGTLSNSINKYAISFIVLRII